MMFDNFESLDYYYKTKIAHKNKKLIINFIYLQSIKNNYNYEYIHGEDLY